jgi:iron uptake system EfeUOB component EfeO/EfeM
VRERQRQRERHQRRGRRLHHDNPLVTDAVAEHKIYVLAQVDETIAATTTFTDAIRAGDLEAAKAAYAPSRQGWERIEPIAGLVEELDGAMDARVDDFEGVDVAVLLMARARAEHSARAEHQP